METLFGRRAGGFARCRAVCHFQRCGNTLRVSPRSLPAVFTANLQTACTVPTQVFRSNEVFVKGLSPAQDDNTLYSQWVDTGVPQAPMSSCAGEAGRSSNQKLAIQYKTTKK